MVFKHQLTWTCHICGQERPDAYISVYKSKVKLSGGIEMEQNVRYCNDNPDCTEKAKTFTFLKGKDGEQEKG